MAWIRGGTLIVSAAPIIGGVALGIGYGNIGAIVDDKAFNQYFSFPSSSVKEALAGIMQAGCILGSMLGGIGADYFGRRGFSVVAAFILVLGSLTTMLPFIVSVSLLPIFLGRSLIGLGGGILCCTVPMYVSEAVLPEYRGAVEATFQLAVEIGILMAYLTNYTILTKHALGWCWSLASQLPLAAVFCLTMYMLPESPRWFLGRQNTSRALESLTQLRMRYTQNEVNEEFRSLQANTVAWEQSLGWRSFCKKRSFIAVVVMTLQVGTGIDMVTVYAPDIFSKVLGGDSEIDGLLYTIFVGVVFVLSTPLAVFSVDRLGRKPLLIVGSIGMTISLAIMAAPLQDGSIVGIVAVLSFVAFFSFSWGPVSWVIPSELLHSSIRARIISIATVTNWIADYTVVSSYLSLSHALGQSGAFGLYAVVNAGALAFVILCVPETKGIELDHDGGDCSRSQGTEPLVA